LEKRTCSILWVLLLFGPLVILIGGIVMLVPDTRSLAIAKYNSAIDDWTNTYRDQFTSSFLTINETEVPLNLTINQSPDALKDNDPKFKTYVPFKYFIPLPKFVISKSWTTPNSTVVTFKINNTVVYYENVTLMQGGNVPVCCDSTPCAECTTYGGTWDGQDCKGVFVLTDYCIKFDFDKDKKAWGPSRDPGNGFGCGVYNDDWDTQQFAHINPSSYPHIYPYSGNFTIRSARDPYIVAAKLTSGSLNFGLSRAEKLRIGLVLIICGGIFLTPVAIIFIVCCQHMVQKHKHLHGQGYSPVVN